VALLVPLLEQWYIKTEALSFLYDYDVMVIISINFRTGNTVSLLAFFIGENSMYFVPPSVRPEKSSGIRAG
jgi:hypothetical protein